MKRLIVILILISALLSGCGKTAVQEHEGIIVVLLDTGVSTSAIDSERLLAGWNYVLDSKDTEDRINHGTAVASVLLGSDSAAVEAMASAECLVVPMVVMDKTEKGTESASPETLAQAIFDAVDRYDADIINVSLGIQSDHSDVKQAVEYAEEHGVLVVSAVGNDGDSQTLYYPATYETVLGVGSHDENGMVSDFSQKNSTADILAPGEDIWLASRNGKTYGSRGSSYATAFVTAAATQLLAQVPSLSAAELRDILCSSAEDICTPGFDMESGWGLLCAERALELLAQRGE